MKKKNNRLRRFSLIVCFVFLAPYFFWSSFLLNVKIKNVTTKSLWLNLIFLFMYPSPLPHHSFPENYPFFYEFYVFHITHSSHTRRFTYWKVKKRIKLGNAVCVRVWQFICEKKSKLHFEFACKVEQKKAGDIHAAAATDAVASLSLSRSR